MNNKLQELTTKLYEEGLSKGREDAETLVAKAKEEAAQIVAEAQGRAAQIVADAKVKAEDTQKNSLTEIALAGRQAIAKLKEAISSMIIAKSVSGGVAAANLDPAFVKEILISVAKNWGGASSDKVELKATLPAQKESELGKTFEQAVKSDLTQGVEILFSDQVKSGFKIEPKDGGFYISFSDADFDALLSEYLSSKVAQILYKKSE